MGRIATEAASGLGIDHDHDQRIDDAPPERWRVTKKLLPGQPGTLKLARRFGAALVCVRYRRDGHGTRRLTTVELIVEPARELQRRPDRLVAVRIRYDERELQSQARSQGARWDPRARVWRMPYRTARRLSLQDRIVGE